jgi:hypothetical protein
MQAREHLAHPLDPALADVHFAEQNIGNHAKHRRCDDDHDPSDA